MKTKKVLQLICTGSGLRTSFVFRIVIMVLVTTLTKPLISVNASINTIRPMMKTVLL